MPGPIPNIPIKTSSEEAIVLLHATEYAALTTRATYLDVFSNAVWALMLAYLTFLANLWAHIGHKVILAWGSAIAIQVMLLAIGFLTFDRYLVVTYIQKHLIPIVAGEVSRVNFWEWEKFLYKRRGQRALVWEWPPALLAFGCPALVLSWRGFSGWEWIDWVGIVVSLSLAIACLQNIIAMVSVRKEWESTFRTS